MSYRCPVIYVTKALIYIFLCNPTYTIITIAMRACVYVYVWLYVCVCVCGCMLLFGAAYQFNNTLLINI